MSKKMSAETNILNWFEIAVNNMDRAAKFYETSFDIKLTLNEMMGMKMAMFPYDNSKSKVGGALVQSKMHKPAATGSVVYLNGNPDLNTILKRIEKAGGKITMPKTLIDENSGYMAFFIDTEGNSIGLHSNE